MDVIKGSHSVGQALRTAALAAGLLTDRRCYGELLAQFYVATVALEKRLEEIRDEEEEGVISDEHKALLSNLRGLGYSFSPGYEKDLEHLLGSGWRDTVAAWRTDASAAYAAELAQAGALDLAAGCFILWGPLAIGGGAMIKPRVAKAFGEGATNVFHDVTGDRGGGRAARRSEFIKVFDGLPVQEEEFAAVVKKCGEFMALNNSMMMSVQQRPWWCKYLFAGAAVGAAVVVAYVYKRRSE